MNKLAYKIHTYLKNNYRIFLIFFIILFSGVLSGVYVFSKTPEYLYDLKEYCDKALSFAFVNELSKKEIFYEYICSNFKIIISIWISGLFIFLIPISFYQVFFKGLRIGYVISYFTSVYGLKGVLYSFFVSLTSYIFIIPLLLIYSVLRIKSFNNKSNVFLKNIFNKKDFVSLLLAACIVLLSGFFDAYVISEILKVFSGFFT